MAFREQDIAMLSTVLKSKKAIEGKFTDLYEAINYLLDKDKKSFNQEQRQPGFK